MDEIKYTKIKFQKKFLSKSNQVLAMETSNLENNDKSYQRISRKKRFRTSEELWWLLLVKKEITDNSVLQKHLLLPLPAQAETG